MTPTTIARDLLSSLGSVLLIGALIFSIVTYPVAVALLALLALLIGTLSYDEI